ncbi:MAG TPA: OsmC family protein [Planctomycetota bacterium]
MTVAVKITYEGSLRCRAVHGPSGTEFVTDAPVDNQGKGESFSPTDLVGTALGTCMLTIMAMAAERHGIDLRGTTVDVEKHMIADPKRRIDRLPVTITVPIAVSAKHRKLLENAAHTCPVHYSVEPRIERPVRFVWVDAPAPA